MNAEAAEIVDDMHAVVPSVSIENMLRQRAAVMERIQTALQLLEEAHAISVAANLGFPAIEFATPWGKGRTYRVSGMTSRPEGVDVSRKSVDQGAWKYLMDESGLKSLMDATARSKWTDQLDRFEFPELTEPNVRATFKLLHDTRGDMFERGVIAAFKRLSWDYKTNLPQKFGKRIIVQLFSAYKYREGISLCLNHRATDELDDLVRVFRVLEGKPEPDHRAACYKLISDAEHRREWGAEHDYFSLKWFKKGSGHLTFKRLDLVDHLNRIIAKHFPGALPAPRG